MLVALATGTSLAWTGRLTPPGAFTRSRSTGTTTAAWLDEHNSGSPPGRVLVAPGAPFATQVWGNQPRRAASGARQQPVGCARLDSADTRRRRSARWTRCSGCSRRDDHPPAWPIPLSGRVFRMSWSETTSTRRHRGRHGRCWCTARSTAHRDCRRSPSSANRSGPARCRASSPTAGCGRSTRRSRSIRVDGADPTGAPYLTDTDAMARVDGGPEALLRLDERRRLLGQPPLGPMLLTADAQRAGLPTPVVTVTDTPLARETDYGRVDDHSSAIRAQGDARHTFNRVTDYPAGDAELGATATGPAAGSRCRARQRTPPRCPTSRPAAGPAAAIDGDSSTSWVSNCLQSAVGQWLQVDFDHPDHQRHDHHHTECDGRRRAGSPHRDLDRKRHQHAALRRAGQADDRGAAVRRDAVGADHRGRHRRRLTRRAVRHHRLHRHPVRRVRFRPADRTCAIPSSCPDRRRVPLSHNGIWGRSCSAGPVAPTDPTACGARRPWRCRRRSR